MKGWISNRDLGNDDSFRNDSSDGREGPGTGVESSKARFQL